MCPIAYTRHPGHLPAARRFCDEFSCRPRRLRVVILTGLNGAVMSPKIEWHPSLGALPFSPIRKMFNTAAEMEDVIHLSIGQPDFPTPPHIIDAMVHALRQGKTRYELDAGLPELRAAVAGLYNHLYELKLTDENVLVTTGCCQAMFMALTAAVRPGMEVIVVEPVFVLVHIIELAGAIPRAIVTTAENGYQVDPQQVIDAMTEKTCAIMINSPGNPTGTIYPRDTIDAICQEAARRNIAVISDEVYDRLILEGDYASAMTSMPTLDNVIMTSSVSKTYSMAGLRLGWVISSRENIVNLQRYHMFISTNENTPTQWATVAALTGDQSCVETMVREYRSRRDRVVEVLHDIGLRVDPPKASLYVWARVPEGYTSAGLTAMLLEERDIVVTPGTGYGRHGEGYIRLSLTISDDDLETGLERLSAHKIPPAADS